MNSITSTSSRLTNLHLDNNEAGKANNDVVIHGEARTNSNEKNVAQGLPADQVSISDEAAEKLSEENKTKNIDGSDGAKQKSIMELAEELKQKVIDDIKERIEELTEEMQRLETQGDESSKEQAKLLQGQINDLNAQLLTIMSTETAAV